MNAGQEPLFGRQRSAEVGLQPNRCRPRSSYQKQQRLVVVNAHIAVATGDFQMTLGFGQRTDGNIAEPREIADARNGRSLPQYWRALKALMRVTDRENDNHVRHPPRSNCHHLDAKGLRQLPGNRVPRDVRTPTLFRMASAVPLRQHLRSHLSSAPIDRTVRPHPAAAPSGRTFRPHLMAAPFVRTLRIYPSRKTTDGSIRAARRAGSHAAARAIAVSTIAAPAMVTGSPGSSP